MSYIKMWQTWLTYEAMAVQWSFGIKSNTIIKARSVYQLAEC